MFGLRSVDGCSAPQAAGLTTTSPVLDRPLSIRTPNPKRIQLQLSDHLYLTSDFEDGQRCCGTVPCRTCCRVAAACRLFLPQCRGESTLPTEKAASFGVEEGRQGLQGRGVEILAPEEAPKAETHRRGDGGEVCGGCQSSGGRTKEIRSPRGEE